MSNERVTFSRHRRRLRDLLYFISRRGPSFGSSVAVGSGLRSRRRRNVVSSHADALDRLARRALGTRRPGGVERRRGLANQRALGRLGRPRGLEHAFPLRGRADVRVRRTRRRGRAPRGAERPGEALNRHLLLVRHARARVRVRVRQRVRLRARGGRVVVVVVVAPGGGQARRRQRRLQRQRVVRGEGVRRERDRARGGRGGARRDGEDREEEG
eukprot:31003-Pelagococcus_subviridis.AAC.6